MKENTQKRHHKKQKSKKANINDYMLKNLQAAMNDNIKPERKERKPHGKGKGNPKKEEVKSSDRSS